MNTTSLSNANSTKILELEDELSSNLRDTVAGREEIEVASFTEDEVISLAALSMRLRVLAGMRDMTGWIEEDEGGKQSSAWDILSAIVERGRLGYKEEEVVGRIEFEARCSCLYFVFKMIEQTLHLLTLHIIWKAKGLTAEAAPSTDDTRYQDALKAQREALMEKLIEYAIGTQSNTLDGVKRAVRVFRTKYRPNAYVPFVFQAFKNLLDLHVLFSSKQTVAADGSPLPTASVALEMDDEVQYRCAGYIQAEIERYADTLADEAGDDDDGGDDEDEDDEGPDGDNTPGSKKKKQKSTVTKTKKAEKEGEASLRLTSRIFSLVPYCSRCDIPRASRPGIRLHRCSVNFLACHSCWSDRCQTWRSLTCALWTSGSLIRHLHQSCDRCSSRGRHDKQ